MSKELITKIQIMDAYGYFVWEIARKLGITEYEVVRVLKKE